MRLDLTGCEIQQQAMASSKTPGFLSPTHTRKESFMQLQGYLVGGTVRVVLLEHSKRNWAAYMSTNASMSVEMILKTVSDRWTIEEHFHDVKEIWGAGEQQVRSVWSSIGCWNLCGWLYSLVELECWDCANDQLVDRSDRPWDNPCRRPSHNDRRRMISRKMLREAFLEDLPSASDQSKIRDRFERLLALAA